MNKQAFEEDDFVCGDITVTVQMCCFFGCMNEKYPSLPVQTGQAQETNLER